MIVTKLIGGLGNQMFQYAVARNLAYKNNSEVKLDINHYKIKVLPHGLPYRPYDLSVLKLKENIATEKDLSLFKSNSTGLLERGLKKIKNIISAPRVIYEPHFNFYPQLLNEKGNIYIDGYWQCEKYFLEIENIIRDEFQIKHSLTSEGFEMLEKIKSTNSICLNIRRQELASNPNLNIFIGLEYIQKTIKYMNEKISNPHFFIFSDELDWVKQNVKIPYDHTIVESNLYGEKFKDCLYLMTHCKHFIIPNSSFGWWAAWLGSDKDKKVVAPEKWLIDPKYNTKDIIPSNWIKI